MQPDERLELADDLDVAAEREVGLEPALEGGQTQLLEACDRRLRERLVGNVGERRTAPEAEGLSEGLRRCRRLGAVRRSDELLEPVRRRARSAPTSIAYPVGRVTTKRPAGPSALRS